MPTRLSRLAVLATLATGCARGPVQVPEQLVGVWTTQDRRYEGRALNLAADGRLAFELGRAGSQSGTVLTVEREQRGPLRRAYLLRYRDEDGIEQSLELEWTLDGRRDVLRMGGRRDVAWTKEGSAP